MFLSKKIAKLNKTSELSSQNPSPHKTLDKEKKKYRKCRFQLIPLPTKFVPPAITRLLYGDIPLTKYNNKLIFDISLYNEFMLFQGIITNKMFDQTVINLKPIRKMNSELPPWAEFVRELINLEMPGWSETVKVYSQKYEKVMKRQSRKKAKTDARKKFFIQATGETEDMKKKLFERFPCVHLKFRLRDHQNQLSEIIFSEDLITSMGYCVESFASTVLEEGLPQFWTFESESSSIVLESLLMNYFALEGEKRQVLDMKSVLLMKNGFMRDVTFNMYFPMNYETNTFGMDLIIAITSKSEPYFGKEKVSVNQSFLDFKTGLETEACSFLIEYYQTLLQGKYKNQDKICIIKELTMEEETKSEDIDKLNEEIEEPEKV